MKKIYKINLILSFLILFMSFYSQTNSQEIYKKPLCVMDLNFGYAAPAFDFAGSRIKDFYDFSGYGANSGFNANFTTKFAAANFSVGQVRPYLTISYAEFQGSENRAYNIGGFIKSGWPRKDFKDTSKLYDPTTIKDTSGTSSILVHSPSIAFGCEVAFFTDKGRRSVFNFGMDFDITVLFGKINDQPTGKNEIYNNLDRNTRLGMGMNLGYTYRVADMLGLTIGTRLQFTNLFGKKTELTNEDGNVFLNDEGNVSINKFLKENRSIGFFGIYGGVSFYIGGKK
jgi:hypothetical protein